MCLLAYSRSNGGMSITAENRRQGRREGHIILTAWGGKGPLTLMQRAWKIKNKQNTGVEFNELKHEARWKSRWEGWREKERGVWKVVGRRLLTVLEVSPQQEQSDTHIRHLSLCSNTPHTGIDLKYTWKDKSWPTFLVLVSSKYKQYLFLFSQSP